MRVLLDTHTLLWFVLGDAALSSVARSLIEDPANENLLSPASYWEIAIKMSLGKYVLPQPYDQFIQHAITDSRRNPIGHRRQDDCLVCSSANVVKVVFFTPNPAAEPPGSLLARRSTLLL
jgi:PIN domain nuclease of toxin-antitoxin system